ncbi:hypothetical protein ACPVPU_07945 [Sphingomonas sp. CJ99]
MIGGYAVKPHHWPGFPWPGSREPMLRTGPDDGPLVLIAQALFEESNRTRAFLLSVMRALASHGLTCALPDLPGMGESETPVEKASYLLWLSAFAECAYQVSPDRPVHVLTLRGGALLTGWTPAASLYQFAPVEGASLVRDLIRARQASGRDAAFEGEMAALMAAPAPETPLPTVTLAGNAIPGDLLVHLAHGHALAPETEDEPPMPRRVARLASDPAPADVRFDAAPLWRRSEPGQDEALATALAADVADWVRQCGG